MTFLSVNGAGLILAGSQQARRVTFPPPDPDPDPSAITPSLVVEYVDTSGDLQSTTINPDGSTVINAVAPFLMFLDASGTRSVNRATEVDAWWYLGYRINYGEGLGGTWTFGGASRDEDTGEPIFGRAMTTVGSNLVRLKIKDGPTDEETISFTANISAPPTPTIIETSAGTWPTFTSGSHYQLRADGDYRSFGTLSCNGLHNILFSKVGSGADPRIARFAPENRGNSTAVLTPARNIRLLDIDCEEFYASIIGFRYCGVVRGRVRTWGNDAPNYYYDQPDCDTAGERENLRYPRGVFLWDCGELNPPSGSNYVMISAFRRLVMSGVDSNKTGVTGNHNLRNSGESCVYRHNRLRNSVASASIIKIQAGSGTTPWGSGDQYGTITGSKERYAYPTTRIVHQSNVYHAAGSVLPDICVGAGPENNDPGGDLGAVELVSFTDSIGYHPTWQLVAGNDVQMNGKSLSTRNIRLNNGTGGYATQSAGSYPNNIPGGWNGPYLYETTNSRPVPSAFT